MNSRERRRKQEAAAARKAQRIWINNPDGEGYYKSINPDLEHGTWNAYNNWYCRCPSCKTANNKHSEEVYHGRSTNAENL